MANPNPNPNLNPNPNQASLRSICSDELYRIGPPERDNGQYRPGDMCEG